MQQRARYDDVVAEVSGHLAERARAAVAAGVPSEHVLLDPGLGFGKTAEHNWSLLRRLDALTALGFPVVVGASRKAFLGALLADSGTPRAVAEREHATTAVTALAAASGAWAVRVHDVAASADAVRVAAAWAGRLLADGAPAGGG
jgi:dihydropteroate synthase